ncbi:choice-of-anchor D domain-containing protein [Pseudorhodoplanes sp.]|uniref:choice-of-anchor D domain-containing protein n=1 Tax=Pseudorhodoplanes sp. TaxID=1934341 RepID=UPI00391A01B4
MSTMITIDASTAASGMNFEAFIRGGFISDATGGGFPVFDNSTQFSGSEMMISYGSDPASKYVLAHGSLEYFFGTHTVWGEIGTIEFGYRGSGSYDGSGFYIGGDVELRITGLVDFSNAVSPEAEVEATGAVHNFAIAYMYGASADPARLNLFGDQLDQYAQHFIGSAYGDVFTGAAFDDLIEGGDGDDTLSGGSGNDTIDGGAGRDTVVYGGNRADYEIVDNGDGTWTVTDTRTGESNEGQDTLTSVEILQFADTSVYLLTQNDDVFSGDSLGLRFSGLEVHGSAGHDYIVTSNSAAHPDTIYGGDGNDLIFTGGGNDYADGGAGDDVIHARGGNNTVIGGEGDDTFVIRFTDTGTTTIIDDDGALWHGTFRPATYPGSWSPAPGATSGYGIGGSATLVSPGVWNLAVLDQNSVVQNLTLSWTGGDLTIVREGSPQTVVIKDYVNGTFGITLENTAPIASDDSASTVKDLQKVIDVLANDTDLVGTLDPTTVTIVDQPANGTVTVNPITGAITYQPNIGYVGPDSFTYTVQDSDGALSNVATVNLTVTAAHILTDGDDVFSGDSLGLRYSGIEVHGGAGDDYIVTSNQGGHADTVYGGDGNDLIFTGGGNDYADGGAGDDVIHARGGNNTVIGGAGDDTFVIRFTDAGTTTIIDDDGALWHGTFRPATYPGSWSPAPGATSGYGIGGLATLVSPGVWNLAVLDQNSAVQNLTLSWTGGDLTIVREGSPQTVVIKDYVNGTFGITLETPVQGPQATVRGNGIVIADNDTTPDAADGTAFGTHAVGGHFEQTFTIGNTGTEPMNLSGLKLPKGFSLAKGEKLPSTLAAGESVTFTVVLNTKKAGDYTGVLSFKTNGIDDALFNFVISATVDVIAPEEQLGDSGDNVFVAQTHPQAFFGGDGVDTVSYESSTSGVVVNLAKPSKNAGFASGDTYDSVENLVGSDFNDTLTGDDGDNVLEGGKGADKLDGGKGINTASYANAETGVTADLSQSKNNTGEAAGDTYKNIQNLLGSAFDDILVGDKKDNAIDGGDGNDVVIGNGGADRLTGGLGSDTFVFNTAKDGGKTGDVITDFVSGEDLIGISKSGFKLLAGLDLSVFQADYFVSNENGVAATATNHGQFVFDESTSQLWWDPDGAGKKAAVLLATFDNGAQLTASDFLLV